MKRIVTLILTLALFLGFAIGVNAEDGRVIYDGMAQSIFFEPGSEHSLTDLFPEFKDVMPGDSLTQKIKVKNVASGRVKVKLYLRSLGANEGSEEFLSKLNLAVAKSDDNMMAYMFDAPANETAQLTDWVYLGTLYSGGEVNLDVTLEVPVSLDNEFKNKVGSLKWEFRVEEFPVDSTDPKPPQTGDNFNLWLYVTLMLCSAVGIIALLIWRKKKEDTAQN